MGMTMTKHKQTVPVPEQNLMFNSFDAGPVYEQRYLPRWEASYKAYYHLPGTHQVFKTHTKDISMSGACLYSSADVHLNQELKLKIYLLSEKNFEASGTVIWKTTVDEDYCCVGVFFHNLPKETQDFILEYAYQFS
jgi:hypothetical protein